MDCRCASERPDSTRAEGLSLVGARAGVGVLAVFLRRRTLSTARSSISSGSSSWFWPNTRERTQLYSPSSGMQPRWQRLANIVCKQWTIRPKRFRLNPLQQMRGTKQTNKQGYRHETNSPCDARRRRFLFRLYVDLRSRAERSAVEQPSQQSRRHESRGSSEVRTGAALERVSIRRRRRFSIA